MESLVNLLPMSGNGWQTIRLEESAAKPLCRQLLNWYGHRRYRGPVPKSDVVPHNFSPQLLPELSILELQADGEFRYRLFGTAKSTLYGEELTGKLLRDAETGEEKEFIHRLFRAVMDGGKPVLTKTNYTLRGVPIAYERLLIPLCDEDGSVRWVLSMTQLASQFCRGAVLKFVSG